MHGERATVSAAQRGIAGGVGGGLQRPGRILNLYRQCLTFGEQPVDPRTFDIQRFEMIIAARNGQPETPHVLGLGCGERFFSSKGLALKGPIHFRDQPRIDKIPDFRADYHPAFPYSSEAFAIGGKIDFNAPVSSKSKGMAAQLSLILHGTQIAIR